MIGTASYAKCSGFVEHGYVIENTRAPYLQEHLRISTTRAPETYIAVHNTTPATSKFTPRTPRSSFHYIALFPDNRMKSQGTEISIPIPAYSWAAVCRALTSVAKVKSSRSCAVTVDLYAATMEDRRWHQQGPDG
jgi:hypothetical protein